MKGNEKIVFIHRHPIPVEEAINGIKEIKRVFPGSCVYFYSEQRNLKQESVDMLADVMPSGQILRYPLKNRFSNILFLFKKRKEKFDIGVIPIFVKDDFSPARYKKVIFISLCLAGKILIYDTNRKLTRIFEKRDFYKLLWYEFFVLCLLIIFLPATFILLAVLAYNRFRALNIPREIR